ncbi:hypothetical protein C8R43DRAFT_975384 [Mycena crocata]|nr:hypothetical protein C8R43DRAFT_975384 [Mycena crocata]
MFFKLTLLPLLVSLAGLTLAAPHRLHASQVEQTTSLTAEDEAVNLVAGSFNVGEIDPANATVVELRKAKGAAIVVANEAARAADRANKAAAVGATNVVNLMKTTFETISANTTLASAGANEAAQQSQMIVKLTKAKNATEAAAVAANAVLEAAEAAIAAQDTNVLKTGTDTELSEAIQVLIANTQKAQRATAAANAAADKAEDCTKFTV